MRRATHVWRAGLEHAVVGVVAPNRSDAGVVVSVVIFVVGVVVDQWNLHDRAHVQRPLVRDSHHLDGHSIPLSKGVLKGRRARKHARREGMHDLFTVALRDLEGRRDEHGRGLVR